MRITVSNRNESGWTVALDKRLLKTPAREHLKLPTRAAAELVANEWRAQETHIDASRMHVTRLANVAVDRTPAARAEMAEEVVRYAQTDLLCHLAEGPEPLRLRQGEHWTPIRDWAGETLGVMLIPVEGIMAGLQPGQSLEAARDYALGLDDFRLTGLSFGLGLFGSALLSMALEQGRLDVQAAFVASRVDEDFQVEQWGADEEASGIATARAFEAAALGAYFDALSAE